MAIIVEYMNYVIFFRDAGEYQAAITLAGGNLLQKSPRSAAALFGIPYPYPTGDMDTIPKGIYFIGVYSPGTQIMMPGPTGVLCDDAVDSIIVLGQQGNPSSVWPKGSDVQLVWSGNIIRMAGAGESTRPPINAISQRRWICGFEIAPNGEGGTNFLNTGIYRDSSRTIDGFGSAIRGTSAVNSWTRSVSEYRTGLTPATSWERFYIRFRRLPAITNMGIWRCKGTPSALAGFALIWDTSGNLIGQSINVGGGATSQGTVLTPTLNQWYRVDIHLKYATGVGTTGIVKIYINGVAAFSYTSSGGNDMNANTSHTTSDLGNWPGVTDNNAEVDFDDWINADLPANVNSTTLSFIDDNFAIDWLLGSHVRVHYVRSATFTNWTGNLGIFNNGISPLANLGPEFVSTTSGAIAEGLTDVLTQATQDTIAPTLGAVAAIVSLFSRNSGGTDGKIGYKIAGGAAVDTTVDQVTSNVFNSIAYLPSGMIVPDEISPFSIRHTKSADANTDSVNGIMCSVEYLGTWGTEDDPLFQFPISRLSFTHNCFYPNTIWGYVGSEPAAPVYAVGGTYTGNGTYQEIQLPAPAHFLWIRPTSGSPTGGIKMFGGASQGHLGVTNRVIPNVRLFSLLDGTIYFSVSGTSIELNSNSVVYEYIAFCDPGGRFNRCGSFSHGTSSPSPTSNPLIDNQFLANAGFVQLNTLNQLVSSVGLYYKGPGNSGSQANTLSGFLASNVCSFSTGVISSESTLYHTGETNYSLWRTSEPACNGTMVQIGSYVGNGINPRTITLTPTSGRFPLFALVVPTNATASFYRDPSHTGSNSSEADNLAVSTTAIVGGGIDSITVQSSLNANGVTYNYFVICGDTAGWNNGTFYNPICSPPDAPYQNPNPLIGNIIIIGEGGLQLGGTTSLTLLKDISGIYTLILNKHNDTLYDRQTGQANIDVKIPDPIFKSGFIGG